MATLKLTKNKLREEQNRLNLLHKYLPTLQLKKAMLQIEVSLARSLIESLQGQYLKQKADVESFSAVLTDRLSFDIQAIAKVKEIKKHYEHIAGVDVPYFDELVFEPFEYSLFDTPVWVDGAMIGLRKLLIAEVEVQIAHEKKAALEKELKEVSIRVNLFEKILIPRAESHIKKIKVFLGDQQLASVSRAKVAKSKIEAAKGK